MLNQPVVFHLPPAAGCGAGVGVGDQKSAAGDRGKATLTKAHIHPDLYGQLHDISENAHTLADLGVTGLDAKFRMPRSGGHGALLTAARQFVKDATPLKDQFTGLNMPADFLDTLGTTITNFENATDDQSGGLKDQVVSTVGLGGTVGDARKALRVLNRVVRNTYKNNPTVLAEWEVASHIESGKAHHASVACVWACGTEAVTMASCCPPMLVVGKSVACATPKVLTRW